MVELDHEFKYFEKDRSQMLFNSSCKMPESDPVEKQLVTYTHACCTLLRVLCEQSRYGRGGRQKKSYCRETLPIGLASSDTVL